MIFAILALLIIHTGATVIHWSLVGAQPAITTTLSAGITASDTTIPVSAVTGFPSSGWVFIEGEVITYLASETPCATGSFAGEPACFTGGTRGSQQTTAISHSAAARVYNDLTGSANDLSAIEQRTAIDQLGDVTSPWAVGAAIVRFVVTTSTWNWMFCFGDIVPLCLIGQMITIALNIGIFVALAALLVSAVGLVARVIP